MARFEHPHDRQMRSVPDRPGLIERLREVAVADEALDQWLGDVSLPDDLKGRLWHRVLDDAGVDAMLCDVAAPAGLIAGIRQSVIDGACVDEMLSETPAPSSLLDRLHEFADDEAPSGENKVVINPSAKVAPGRPWRRRATNALWGSAIALMLVVLQWGAVYRLAGSLAAGRSVSGDELLVADWGPLDVAVSIADGSEEMLVLMAPLAPDEPSKADESGIELHQWELPSRSVFQQLTSEVSAGLDLNLDVWSTRIEHVGYPARETLGPAVLDEVEMAPVMLPGLPRSRAYDRAFHWRHGVSPWTPARVLPKQGLSLHANPARFERLLLQMQSNAPPDPAEVAVEDVLATMDPRWSLPGDGAIALRTAAGPSVFGERAAGLLQMGVAAGAPGDRLISPVRLTVLLDVSAEVSLADLLATQRQLASALRLLRNEDLLTVITIGDEPKVLCEDVGPEQREAVRAILSDYPRQGIADWGRAVPRGVQAALEGQRPGMRQELLIITPGRGEWADSAEQWMDRALMEADRWGVHVGLCGHHSSLTPRVRQWTERHDLTWTGHPMGVQDAVCEALTGQPATIAQDVRVALEFNPDAVAAYRVLGQDASAGQWSDDPTPSAMRAGDQNQMLIEIRWAGEVDDVGWVTLSWHDVHGQLRKQRQRISRIQFAPSFQQSAASLQAAMLAAEAAQILMESPFAKGRTHQMSLVSDQFWECSEEVRSRPELQRLVQALESFDRAPGVHPAEP